MSKKPTGIANGLTNYEQILHVAVADRLQVHQ